MFSLTQLQRELALSLSPPVRDPARVENTGSRSQSRPVLEILNCYGRKAPPDVKCVCERDFAAISEIKRRMVSLYGKIMNAGASVPARMSFSKIGLVLLFVLLVSFLNATTGIDIIGKVRWDGSGAFDECGVSQYFDSLAAVRSFPSFLIPCLHGFLA